METLYYQYNPWWEQGYQVPHFIHRPQLEKKLIDSLSRRDITVLTGLRRVGKTTLMKYVIQHLLETGIPAKQIFYISCDDYLLMKKNLLEILQSYRKLQQIATETPCYIFFDEVTYKENFRLQLKNLYDRENLKIFASSSSSSALRDKRGFLTGREQIIEIHPLTFDEFLLFRDIKIKKRDSHLLESYLEEYMQIGGMPEYVLEQNREYLTSLIDHILYKDIISFHNIRNPHLIVDYFKLLMERAGKQLSINKISNILSISPDTAKRYLQLFADTFLVYLVPRYGKTNTGILSPNKIYAADLGIRNLYTGLRDKGAVFENLVFNSLKPYHPRYIYEDGIELDFMLDTKKILVEVKYGRELTEKQTALFEKFKAKKKVIIQNYDDLMKLLAELET